MTNLLFGILKIISLVYTVTVIKHTLLSSSAPNHQQVFIVNLF